MSSTERSRRSRALLLAGAVLVAAVAIGAAAIAGAFGPAALTPAQVAARARHRILLAQERVVERAARDVAVALPAAEGAPAPPDPGALYSRPLAPHAVYGFVPYWEVASLTAADYERTSVLSYFGVSLGATGALVRSGDGWRDFVSPSFATFVAAAHSAHDRVLFTVSTTDAAVIGQLTSAPGATSERLATELAPVVSAAHLDGVDLDIEGRSGSERAGFVAFVRDLASQLRRRVPGIEIALDTYPQSAASPSDFFDVARLAPQVDALFVMAYDMGAATVPSANSPLASPTLGLSDVGSLLAYVKLVAPAKLVLGLPFYGYDYTTTRGSGTPRVLGSPVAVTYASILASGHRARWDPGSLTPYEVFREAGHWHETWYDDPVSLALKVSLASELHLGGVGAWALGQEGPATQMVAALDGGRPPLKLPRRAGAG